ncbi:MAG: GvpL/GvpF family gas vesicle protein [Planctomycetes bacterium]|nr:GvpL/GvpF family gas vesicle protein [Planctomycetota bacterium]MBI3844845.1 GvpL/GvpF family gas vesicle protein [Planctomycetota bacterium]
MKEPPKHRDETSRAVYLYGLVRSSKRLSLARGPDGMPDGSRPRLLDAGRALWVVVSDVPLSRYGEAPLEKGLHDLEWVSRCALAHESVLERFVEKDALIPTKLFTIFASDARVLTHVERTRAELDDIVRRVSGCSEWSVRVIVDEEKALRAAVVRSSAKVGPGQSGAGFLRHKKAMRDAVRDLQTLARTTANDLFANLAKFARARAPVRTLLGGPRLVLDAAFLVPFGATARFRGATKRFSTKRGGLGREALKVTVSGPWPPYHFVGGPP